MDIVAAARQRLLASPSLLALLGSGQGFAHWIFVGPYEGSAPFVQMDGSQQAAVVLAEGSNWLPPNMHNTMQFPSLRVDVYLDPIRDASGNAVSPDLKPRFLPVQRELVRILHRPQGDVELWGDVRTLGSQQLGSWQYSRFSDTDGTGIASSSFGIALG